ncbi:unnamed protein product [Calypogeia fissa]
MSTEEMSQDIEKAPKVEFSEVNVDIGADHSETFPRERVASEPSAQSTTDHDHDGDSATPSVLNASILNAAADGSEPREISLQSKRNPLGLVHLLLRIMAAVFTLVAVALISTASFTPTRSRPSIPFSPNAIKFNDFFFFSYLVTVDVFTCAYAIVTIFMSVIMLHSSFNHHVVVGSHGVMFFLDQIVSFLLISAGTSAATGIRIEKSTWESYNVTDDFLNRVYTSTTCTFLAFFALAALALVSAHHAPPKTC